MNIARIHQEADNGGRKSNGARRSGMALWVAATVSFAGLLDAHAATHISENIQSWTAQTSYGSWTQSIPAGTVNMTQCIVAPTAAANGVCTVGRVQMQGSTGILELPAVNTAGVVSFNLVAGGAGRSVKLQQNVSGGGWVDVVTFSGIGTTGVTYSHEVNNSSASIALRLATPSAALYVHDILVEDHASSTPPAFGADPGPVSTTTGVAVAFTVTASGNPAPTLALQSQTASSGFSFTPATGVLDYTPPTSDVGARIFTFTASNTLGTAMQTVTVNVAEAPVAIPTVSVTNIGTNSFTVNWTACDGATEYQVQIAADTNFAAGGGANQMTNPGFETGDSTGWDKFETEYSVVSTDPQEGIYHVAITATATRDLTQNVNITGDGVTEYEISYWYKGSGNARIWSSWTTGGQVSGDSLQPVDYNPAAAAWTQMVYTVVPQSGANTLFYEIRTYNGASMQYDNFYVGEGAGGGGGSLVLDETVAALTYAAAGLSMETTYFVRARQTGGEWSGVVSATTAGSEPSVPVFTGGAGPYGITVGEWLDFTVSAIGTPAPVLALSAASAHVDDYAFEPATGYFLYQPPLGDGGTVQTFTFTASNTEGVATQVVSVTVSNVLVLPTIDPLSPLTIEAGQTTNLWVVARETEGDLITLFASNLPANASFTTVTGTGAVSNQFSFSPSSNQAGQAYAVVFYAGDADGTNSATLNITVPSNDPWAEYYASCYTNGVLKTGVDLKNALHTIIDGHTSFSYAATENILKIIDECPTNSTMVQLLYLQHGRDKSNFGGSAGQWNREHVWANSHGINDSLPAYTDVHHLHPADVTVNNTRGDKDFDTVSGLSNTYSYSSTAFEPPDAAKGDVARAMFYMAVRYDGSDGVGNLELTNIIPTSGAWHGKLDTLMDWNELDPVNDYEIRRNDLIYSNYQGNRNPFVDHPEWVRVVFDTNYVAAPPPPAAFAATPNGSGQIDLSFTLNGRGDDVVIVWDEDGTFSVPSGPAPAVGQSFAGGTVLYTGGTSPQSHTGLTACQTRYYTCWSYSGTNYSAGVEAVASTPGPGAPAAVWASETNTTDFTAAWSGVAGVSSYRLDVSPSSLFAGEAGEWETVFRETMGTVGSTTALSTHETADGFDNIHLTMTDGGAANPADVRPTASSSGYFDPAGQAASGEANIWFTSTTGERGFGIEGIDVRGFEALQISFGYRKEDANANMSVGVEWSTNSGSAWNSVAVSNLPAENAGVGWYMVSNLAVSAAALDSTGLSLRWIKTGEVAGRVDDILLQGRRPEPLFLPGYSNRTVTGATSAAVTGLTAGATFYFRVASLPDCQGSFSSTGSVTTTDDLLQDQTIDFPAIGDQVATDTVGLAATASSGLDVSFAVGSGPASISGSTHLSFTGAGEVSIVASQAGDANWNPAPNVTHTFNVTKALATVTLGNLSQMVDGAPKNATVTTVPEGLLVVLTYDGSPVAPSAAGTYAVTGTVNEALYQGSASGMLQILTVSNLFVSWLDDRALNPEDPDYAPDADVDEDGMTTWEEFLADTDPANSNDVLALSGSYLTAAQVGQTTGQIEFSFPASPHRYYQLIYTTDLVNRVIGTNNIGWGVPGMVVTSDAPAAWYGTIRVLLADPNEP